MSLKISLDVVGQQLAGHNENSPCIFVFSIFWFGRFQERFDRLRFSVPAVPLQKGFFCVSVQFNSKGRFGSGFGSWKTVPAVPVPLSVSGKTVPTVPVSGSGFRFRFGS